MGRDPKYDVLFEPVAIGPKTLRNRFWQVPHCNGAGVDRPGMQAAFRATKAEGGWSAVFTEVCMVVPHGDVWPMLCSKLWDDGDVRNLAAMCDAVHEHDSLAGVELAHSGGLAHNGETRLGARHPSQITSDIVPWATPRAMDKADIRQSIREHVDAAKRARAAGFDLITILATLATHPNFFLYKQFNKRTDEYGGSFENRCRYTKELFESLREEIDDCAIGMRFAVDTLDEPYGYGDNGVRADGEGLEFIAAFDEYVDYWDINVGTLNWGEDAGSSRFFPTNHEAQYTRNVKTVATKPVVNVGRFTDPDVMVEVITSGQCDIIGAARPSIADPFLPKKIEEGRFDDIRECIGCNMCVSRWESAQGPIWCTQNATSGEEYRRGWHPERFSAASNGKNDVLVIGAGPAGMECAMVLGKRGMRRVHLVDAAREMGGHLRWVTTLPGLGQWARVTNYRQIQIDKLRNVEFIKRKRLSTADVLDYGAEYVVVATGSHWAPDGLNGLMGGPVPGADASLPYVATPDQVMVDGKKLGDHVVVFDAEAYFMGVSMAEKLARDGHRVTYVTPFDTIAPYMRFTLEEQRMYQTLVEVGVEIVPQHLVVDVREGGVTAFQHWAGREFDIACDGVVLVTQRLSDCSIYEELSADQVTLEDAGIKGVFLIGDAEAPGFIAQAVFSGHRLAREIDTPDPAIALPFIRERRVLGSTEHDELLSNGALSTRVG
jgi:dimethylamine/trimethylamine dehydrogenase